VRVEGLPEGETAYLGSVLQARHAGRPPVRGDIEDSILRISGTDRYEVITYGLHETAEGTELVLRITPKSFGPPFLLPALDVQNIDSNSFSISLRLRVAVYDMPFPNSELRLDAGVGSNQLAGLELVKRVGRTGFFAAPRAYFSRHSLNGYDADGELVAEYRVKRTGFGVDLGYSPGLRSEVRLGYDEADVRARRRVGTPTLLEANGSDSYASLRWVFDGQNSPIIPSRGLRVLTAMRYYFDTPEIVDASDAVIARARNVPQGEVNASWFKRIGTRQRLFLNGGGGTSFNKDPGLNQFRLGGPLRLSALSNDEIRGNHYLLGVIGVLHEWFRLPDLLGGQGYVGAWLDQGSAYNTWKDAEYQASLSTGVVLETLLGPAFVGYSRSLTGSNGRFYVSLGPFTR
jgi:NTE family protein